MNDQLTLYLLTIRGMLAPETLEAARKVPKPDPAFRMGSGPSANLTST